MQITNNKKITLKREDESVKKKKIYKRAKTKMHRKGERRSYEGKSFWFPASLSIYIPSYQAQESQNTFTKSEAPQQSKLSKTKIILTKNYTRLKVWY